MNYRMTGSLKMIALYRCEYCQKVALHQISLKKRTNYDSTWTSSGLEKRRSRKQEELSEKLSKEADRLSKNSSVKTFLGKTIEGKCPHCQKRQAWMRMSYSLWVSYLGVLAFISAVGVFSIYTFEGHRSQLYSMQSTLSAIIAFMILLALGLVVHAAVMLMRTRRILQKGPVILARMVDELVAKAAEHPEYLAELQRAQNQN